MSITVSIPDDVADELFDYLDELNGSGRPTEKCGRWIIHFKTICRTKIYPKWADAKSKKRATQQKAKE